MFGARPALSISVLSEPGAPVVGGSILPVFGGSILPRASLVASSGDCGFEPVPDLGGGVLDPPTPDVRVNVVVLFAVLTGLALPPVALLLIMMSPRPSPPPAPPPPEPAPPPPAPPAPPPPPPEPAPLPVLLPVPLSPLPVSVGFLPERLPPTSLPRRCAAAPIAAPAAFAGLSKRRNFDTLPERPIF